MEETTQKTVEQKAMERTANTLLNFIIAKTYARHANLTEEEYLKEIGFEGSGKTENEAFRVALMNLRIETQNKIINTRKKNQNITECIKKKLIYNDEYKGE